MSSSSASGPDGSAEKAENAKNAKKTKPAGGTKNPDGARDAKNGRNAKNGRSAASSKSAAKPRKGVIIGVLVAVVALLAGWVSQAVVSGGGSGDGSSSSASGNATVEGRPDDSPAGDPALLALARRDGDDPYARGDKDAPVVMIEYADFGCSFCGKFARDTEPKLEKKYIDKGLLRVEWRNFPVFGKGSERAALAGIAAGRQGRFWEFYRTVYADKGNEKNAFTDDHLHEIAEQAGVKDLDRFDRDRASDDAKKLLDKDRNEAYGLGASATPAFLVNGEPIAGAQPDEVFTDAIERAAAAAKKKGSGGEGTGTADGKADGDGKGDGKGGEKADGKEGD
ncbi:DsbA family protein [Streptomyces cacaoi]|uniref:DsbA family protein n=1 Tax=Streptomyces cacaoi TaxID=1898 RepID=UPI0011F35518|nr:thioredoxin domain-containing protein [Streptomyces cacaoi]